MIKIELSEKEGKDLTDEEKEIAIARKLEVSILPLLKRNINFFYTGANIPKKSRAYNDAMSKEELEAAMNKKSQSIAAVCKPLCEMVVEILRDNGLNAETVSCDTDLFRHVDVLLTTSSGKQYIINYLEDIENVQAEMKTPDFASKAYYQRRYQKFEGGLTTDGKSIDNIAFLSEEQIGKIDENLGYKKYGMYMDDVIEQLREEFSEFREIMAENEYMQEDVNELSEIEKEKLKKDIYKKYQYMSDDSVLEQKLDWIFNYFNTRRSITGHTDFVMYYSRLLLSRVLSSEEYKKLTRYDCFVQKDNIPEESKLENILDYNNQEDERKLRFCLLECGEKTYAFSTKPNVYNKLGKEDIEEISKYAIISKSQRPSDLVLKLCDKGSALPLIFHPLGSKMLNERASMIDSSLSEEAKKAELEKLAASIKTTDGEVTSITIPYPNGGEKYIYIDKNNEFAVRTKSGTKIYHYNEEQDSFNIESVGGDER